VFIQTLYLEAFLYLLAMDSNKMT